MSVYSLRVSEVATRMLTSRVCVRVRLGSYLLHYLPCYQIGNSIELPFFNCRYMKYVSQGYHSSSFLRNY